MSQGTRKERGRFFKRRTLKERGRGVTGNKKGKRKRSHREQERKEEEVSQGTRKERGRFVKRRTLNLRGRPGVLAHSCNPSYW